MMNSLLIEAADAAHRAIHKTVAAVSGDLDKFHFNKAVARIRELTNVLDALECDEAGVDWVLREGYETVVRLIGPMMPHIAEELWQQLGHDVMLTDTAWPEVDETLLVEDTATVAIQVNGKLRGTVDLPKGCDAKEAEKIALSLPRVAEAVEGKDIRKVIVVPDRIINVVI